MPASCSKIGVLVAQARHAASTHRPRPAALSAPISLRPARHRPPPAQVVSHSLSLCPHPPTRRSAALYANIWTDEGSPLMVHSQAQTLGLQERLGAAYRVVLGMRYGEPSIARAVQSLEQEGIERILVFPMFPQFSCATTGSIYDAVNRAGLGSALPLVFQPANARCQRCALSHLTPTTPRTSTRSNSRSPQQSPRLSWTPEPLPNHLPRHPPALRR